MIIKGSTSNFISFSADIDLINDLQENAKKQLSYVREASKKYILPKKEEYSDITINGACSLDYFTQIMTYIYKITNRFSV